MPRVYKPRKKRIPLAASAARSQQDRDTFFGGKASALSGSKSTRGGRPVGRDRRSAAAVASAGAPIVANRASAAPKAEPVEKEMDDKIEATVSKLAEPAMEIPQEAKDVYEGLQDKPVEESMEMPDYAKEVYEGALAPVANQSFKGMDSAGQTVLEDAPAKPKGFLESMMERFPKFAEAYKGMAENRALNEMLKKEMDRAKMSEKAADFLGFMEDKPVENPASRYEARGKGAVDMKKLNLKPLEKKPKKLSEKTFLESTIHNLFNPMKNEFR